VNTQGEDTENEEQLMENIVSVAHGDSVANANSVKHVPNGLKKQILQNLVLEAVLDKAMEDMLAAPSALPESSDETKIGNDSKNDDKVMEEAEDEKKIPI